jgi:peptidoglycan/xylan/chitin deacetylase (PgdA/CDA1 family)
MNGTPILGYHSIDDSGSSISIAPSQFEEQMGFLYKKEYKTITLRDYLDSIMMNQPTPRKSIVLTFDDGYKNNYDIAFPILRVFGFTATIFLVTGFMGKTDSWEKDKGIPDFPLLSWNEVLEMKKYGIDFQPHSHSHPLLTDLTGDEIKAELINSKKEIESRLNKKAEVFCYPHGKYDDEVIKILKDLGFKAAVTTRFGWNYKPIDFFKIERIVSRWFRKRPWAFRVYIKCSGSMILLRAIRWHAEMKSKSSRGV